jgi:hypothetical protein
MAQHDERAKEVFYRKEALEFYAAPAQQIHELKLPSASLLFLLVLYCCVLLGCLWYLLTLPITKPTPVVLISQGTLTSSAQSMQGLLILPQSAWPDLHAGIKVCAHAGADSIEATLKERPVLAEPSAVGFIDGIPQQGITWLQAHVSVRCRACKHELRPVTNLLVASPGLYRMAVSRGNGSVGGCE